MKKNIIIASILSLLTLSGCVTFDDPENDPYRSPDLFYEEVVKYYNKHEHSYDRSGWRIDSSKLKEQLHGHADYSGRMASHLKDIKDFKEVKSIEESGDYFTYHYYCVECPRVSMTVYDNGSIFIEHPKYRKGGKYYYSIDPELATSIHSSMIEEASYYSNLKDEEEKYASNAVNPSNFFNYIEGTNAEVSFMDINISPRRTSIENNQDFRDYLKNIDYRTSEIDDTSVSKCTLFLRMIIILAISTLFYMIH